MKYYKLLLMFIAVILASCNAQERVLYLQDVTDGSEIEIPDNYIIRIKPLDQITIVVNSTDPELAAPFNTSTGYSSISGLSTASSSTTTNNLQSYTVGEDGYIDMPILGRIECVGLTREQLASKITKLIIDGGYIADPKVNVSFSQLSISVIGEVSAPGHFSIQRDKITIFDALAMAKDLTIYGDRENVAVIREKDGKRIITKLDLRSAEIFNSPCYYLEQNDIVIVSPNKYRAATSEINQNRSFWISLTSTAISLATLAITIFTVTK